MTQNTTIRLVSSYTATNTLKIDVVAENVPPNLFGAAFHLKVKGGEWEMVNFAKGDVFAAVGDSPLVLAQEKTSGDGREIVFGITMKRTDPLTAKDGVLVSFGLKVEPGAKLNLDLSDVRLVAAGTSVTELAGVKWEGVSVDTVKVVRSGQGSTAGTLTDPVAAGSVAMEGNSAIADDSALYGTGSVQAIKSDIFQAGDMFEVYLVMAVFAGFVLVVMAVYLLARRLTRRIRE